MKHKFKSHPGSIVAPQGFCACGVFADIKRLGTGKGSDKGRKPDLALIVSAVPAAVAGMFTTNQTCAPPVKVCLACAARGIAQAIVANSGNANACTGQQGLRDARTMARWTAQELGLKPGQVLVGSTGRIGLALPMENIRAGIAQAVTQLGSTPAHADAAAQAVMTSDTRAKKIAVSFPLSGRTVRLGGICKGAGMIQPGMSADGRRPAAAPQGQHATMLCFLTTDAAVQARALQAALQPAVAESFNRITVDGDMSTNDTVLVLANGLAKNPLLTLRHARQRAPDFLRLQSALSHVCLELAKMIVRDGEGVHRVVTVRVQGAKTAADADAAARAVANSPLVKTSWHGGDPNWGRIMAALGYSAATVVERKVDIGYSACGGRKILWSLKGGRPTRATFAQLCRAVAGTEFELHIRLNLGRGQAVLYAADLTEAYVDFNKGDLTDPHSLGG
jgi:glutamate N-acetyltransferase/amino-acid N-acetyltransferase